MAFPPVENKKTIMFGNPQLKNDGNIGGSSCQCLFPYFPMYDIMWGCPTIVLTTNLGDL